MDISVYCKDDDDDVKDRRLLPNPLRCLIVGSSGCGKTNLLLNFIYNRRGVPFKHLYVFSRSIEQPAYTRLRRHYERVEKLLGHSIAHFFSNCEDLIPLDECRPNSLVVFDDCLLEEQGKIKDYFIRGRHKRVSCVYLSQSYGRVDMQVIRNNVNMLCAFTQNRHYTKRIYEDFVGSDMAFESFAALCKHCWDRPHGFITVDTTRKTHTGKYKCMLEKNDISNVIVKNDISIERSNNVI